MEDVTLNNLLPKGPIPGRTVNKISWGATFLLFFTMLIGISISDLSANDRTEAKKPKSLKVAIVHGKNLEGLSGMKELLEKHGVEVGLLPVATSSSKESVEKYDLLIITTCHFYESHRSKPLLGIGHAGCQYFGTDSPTSSKMALKHGAPFQ